jgi:hypothetical protein
LSQNNLDERPKITNFDFLLGFFVILAMDEHFTYYLNWWYIDFFKEFPALRATYQIHLPMLEKNLQTDHLNAMLGNIFIPWVSQIYLSLAAFKLAGKDSGILNQNLFSRLKIYLLIILVFIFENFFVAPDFGQAISIYPITIWMIILTLLTFIYAKFDIKGIVFILIISLCRWFTPIDEWSDFFQLIMIKNIHPGFEYDARIEYFLTSGCLGFILGYIYYHKEQIKEKFFISAILMGLLLASTFFLSGGSFYSDPTNSLSNEHELTRTFQGSIYIWGMIVLVISLMTTLEMKNIKINLPIINWVGKNSLTIFGTHRILFLKIIMPISMFIGAMSGRTIGASTIEIYIYIAFSIALGWILQKLKLHRIIFPQKL